jgi:CRP-like cAMP-binding protein
VTLRQRLQALGAERGDQHEARVDLERRIAEALLEVNRRRGALPTATHVTLSEAAQLLGLSRPSAYRLLEQAERRKS